MLFQKMLRFWPVILVGIMFIIFITNATKQENLDVYKGGGSTYTVEKETEPEKKIITNTYMNEKIDLTMQIPDGWTHIIKDGYDTYIHSASASSVQIQVMPYYPMINNTTVQSISDVYSSRGYTISEFQYTADNSYYVIYQSNGMDGVTDYIECVIWDRQNVAKIVFTFNDGNYEKLKETIWYCIESISWDYEDPISDGFFLRYQPVGDFEFAVPDNWTVADTETSFYAYEENTGASLAVNLLDDQTLLSDITQVDYTNFLSNGKSDFALTQFQQTESMIYGEATYTNNGIMTALLQTYYANGKYHYILTYEYPIELGNNYAAGAQSGFNLTRIFYTPEKDDVTENETVQSSNNSIFTPEGIPQSTTSEQVTNESEKSNPEETDSETQTDTFSDALIQIAGISDQNAAQISSIWDTLNLGIPTYAEGYAQSDTSIIVLVTNNQNINYYLYISKSGELTEIHVNTDDGKVIYSNEN